VAEHTVKAFDDDITRLRGPVAEMGGLAELSITEAMEALVGGNEELAAGVIARDKRIDQLEGEVDRLAIRVLALRAPMADDLREVIAALKIAGVIERIGDYAKNIAKRVGHIAGRKRFEPLTLLPIMNEMASDMVHDVLTAYAARDAVAAAEIVRRDAKVDAIYDSVFRNLSRSWWKTPPRSAAWPSSCSWPAISSGSATRRPTSPRSSTMPPPAPICPSVRTSASAERVIGARRIIPGAFVTAT
jgi:phosphate transport system protein